MDKQKKIHSMVGVERNLDKPILVVTEGYKIGERLAVDKVDAIRILLEPSECYLNDPAIGLEGIIKELVELYNGPRYRMVSWQMHHIKIADKGEGPTKFIAQNSFCESDPYGKEKFKDWANTINKLHPCPEGYEWLFCNQHDHRFVMCDPDSIKEVDDG